LSCLVRSNISMRNRFGNFSVERLRDFLIVLGQDVDITAGRLAKNTVRYRLSLLEFRGSSDWRGLTMYKLHRFGQQPVKTRPHRSRTFLLPVLSVTRTLPLAPRRQGENSIAPMSQM